MIDHYKNMIQRLPTGRAWRGSIQRRVLEVIADKIKTLSDELIDMSSIELILGGDLITQQVLLNDQIHALGSTFAMLGEYAFSTGEQSIWEWILDLLGTGTDEERLQAIVSALINSGSISLSHVQKTLNDSGFDVYLYRNVVSNGGSVVFGSNTNFNGLNLGGTQEVQFSVGSEIIDPDIPGTTLCVNYVDEDKDESLYRTKFTSDPRRWEYVFFIGGSPLETYADVPIVRKNEFRELILRIKPAGMWAVLFINYT